MLFLEGLRSLRLHGGGEHLGAPDQQVGKDGELVSGEVEQLHVALVHDKGRHRPETAVGQPDVLAAAGACISFCCEYYLLLVSTRVHQDREARSCRGCSVARARMPADNLPLYMCSSSSAAYEYPRLRDDPDERPDIAVGHVSENVITEAKMAGKRRLLVVLSAFAGANAFAPSAALVWSGRASGALPRACAPPPLASVRCSSVEPAAAAPPTATLRDLPPTSRALWGDKVGNSFRDVAVVKELPILEPKAGEVLIQVSYCGVNGGCETFRSRGENWFADNKDKKEGFPLGAEGVGLVARVGPDVHELKEGDAVSFIGGAFAEYVVAPAPRCTKVKEASAAAVAARISGTTAMGAVAKMGKAQKRQVVLVTAAAGAAGSFAVQIAKSLGCHVIGTCSTAEKAQLLCELGCDTIINHRTRDVGEVLANKYPQGVDLVVEHVGGHMFQTALEHLKPKGRLILVGYISEYPHNNHAHVTAEAASHAWDLADIFWRQKILQVPGTEQTISGKLYPSMSEAAEARQEVQERVEDGRLRAVVDRREFVGVDSVPDAVDYMLSGAALGKVVVRM